MLGITPSNRLSPADHVATVVGIAKIDPILSTAEKDSVAMLFAQGIKGQVRH